MRDLIEVSVPVRKSARVLQVSGMFDLPVEEKLKNVFDVDLPIEEKPWSIGLIVGPSGSGKSTIANHFWPSVFSAGHEWSSDRSLLDDFPKTMSVKEVVGLLTSVGLGSPPAWIRPFRTLSNGEAFRASMARTLAETKDVVVVDEFTSVVDRQVAKVASHAVQKTVRRTGRQMIAVTCHYDVIDWLQPDWVYDTAAQSSAWRSVQPHPRLDLRVHRETDHSLWPLFARHHYLSADLHRGAHCFTGWIGEEPVAFTSYLHFPHAKTRNIKMGHRLVVLPDYQGLGIGGRMDDWLGQHLFEQGLRYHNVISHPAMIRYYSGSPRWQEVQRRKRLQNTSTDASLRAMTLKSRSLGTRSFEYRPPARDEQQS
jgi:ABC-type ATPase involved in cell division/GNAT superfamily N-acetyltransferase